MPPWALASAAAQEVAVRLPIAALLALSLAAPVTAQASRADLTTAVVAIDTGDLDRALMKIEEALADSEDFRDKDWPKAYLTLARTLLGLHTQERAPEGAVLRAAEALRLAVETDTEGRYERDIERARPQLMSALMLTAVNNRASEDPAVRAQGAQALTALDQAFPDSWRVPLLRLQLDASDDAAADCTRTLDMYEADPHSPPLLDMVWVAQRGALAVGFEADPADPVAALAFVARGQRMLDAMGTNLDAAEQADVGTYRDALTSTELTLLASAPSLREQAMARFEAQLEQDPHSLALLINYGGLQQAEDPDAALATYQRARQAHPDAFEPAFAIAAVYVNALVPVQQALLSTLDPDPVLQARADELVGLARAAMEAAHAIDPSHTEVLRQLVQLTGLQGDDEAFAEYRGRLTAAGG